MGGRCEGVVDEVRVDQMGDPEHKIDRKGDHIDAADIAGVLGARRFVHTVGEEAAVFIVFTLRNEDGPPDPQLVQGVEDPGGRLGQVGE